MVRYGAQSDHHLEELRQVLHIMFRDGGVHLELHADLLEVLDGLHHALERAFHPPEIIVLLRGQPVDRERHAHDAGVLHLLRQLLGHEQTAGRHDHAQTELGPVLGDIVDVGAHHGLAAGQDDDRVAEGLDVIEELVRVLGRELARVGTVPGRGAAVDAVQDAAAGHLPGDQPGEVFFFAAGMAVAMGRFHGMGMGHEDSLHNMFKVQ